MHRNRQKNLKTGIIFNAGGKITLKKLCLIVLPGSGLLMMFVKEKPRKFP